ncbi:NACHT domain-containing protein [Streptomyces sp. NBC_00433]
MLVLMLGGGTAGVLAIVWCWLTGRTSLADAGVSALGLVFGLASLAVSWLAYRGAGESFPAIDSSASVEEFAVAVRSQWDAEARVRRLNDPYPLPVSWRPADSGLTESWSALLRLNRAAIPAVLASTGDDIGELFLQRLPGRRLIVLGQPGSGKTMLLLRLALELLEQRPAGGPVPVIFALASWDPHTQDLESWMAERLAVDYPAFAGPGQSVGRAQTLLEHRLVVPLLDGLDELAPRSRAAALDAINQALPPGRPLVLSSRLAEYRTALRPSSGVPVRLSGAAGIELQPVDAVAAAAYLRRDAGGTGTESAGRWERVCSQLGSGAPVAVALSTPLALFLARTIYNPRPGEGPEHLPGLVHDRVTSELACPVGRVGRMSLCPSLIRKSSVRTSCGSRGTAARA